MQNNNYPVLIEQKSAYDFIIKLVDNGYLTLHDVGKINKQTAHMTQRIRENKEIDDITLKLLVEEESFFVFLGKLVRRGYLNCLNLKDVDSDAAIKVLRLIKGYDVRTICRECGGIYFTTRPERECTACVKRKSK